MLFFNVGSDSVTRNVTVILCEKTAVLLPLLRQNVAASVHNDALLVSQMRILLELLFSDDLMHDEFSGVVVCTNEEKNRRFCTSQLPHSLKSNHAMSQIKIYQ
jgi:hypothetical protein